MLARCTKSVACKSDSIEKPHRRSCGRRWGPSRRAPIKPLCKYDILTAKQYWQAMHLYIQEQNILLVRIPKPQKSHGIINPYYRRSEQRYLQLIPSQNELRAQTITVRPGANFDKARMAAIIYLQLVSSRIKLSQNQTQQGLSILIKIQRPPREALEALKHVFPWAPSFAIENENRHKKTTCAGTRPFIFYNSFSISRICFFNSPITSIA